MWFLVLVGTLEALPEEGPSSLMLLPIAAWMGPILGWLVCLLTLPLSLPFAWLSVHLLRVASGGPARQA